MMSESTASRLDRVGREQRREERQRTSSSVSASSSLVSSSSLTPSSSSIQSPIVDTATTSNDEPQILNNAENENSESHISTSSSETDKPHDMATVKILTNPNSSFLQEDEAFECSSSQQLSENVSDQSKRSRNAKHPQKKELTEKKGIEKEQEMTKSEGTRNTQDIDVEYSDEEKEEGTYAVALSGNVSVSASILNEPSNFMAGHMKNSSETGGSTRITDNIPNSSKLPSGIVMQLEACSLGKITPNEENISQGLERQHIGLNGDIETNNSYDSQSEHQYPWRRKTTDDEVCLTANNSQYSSDVEVVISNSRRNVNMVEVNMGAGHATKSGRKIRNRDVTTTESFDQSSETENSSERTLENNQRSTFEAVLPHSTPQQHTDNARRSSLERSSSLKSATLKTRHSKVSTSSSQSNIPGRSNSPSPSRRNVSNSKSKSSQGNSNSSHSANAVNSFSHSTGPYSNSVDPDPSNLMKQNLVQNALGLYNWQATKMTVKERLAFLFNNNILSDVTFVVGRDVHQQRIPAHRFVLSVGSAVFDAMFNRHSSKTGTSAIEEEIELPDVEPASFLALLRFLYSDEVQIGPETVMTTLYTAKKYAVPALEKHCVDFLKRHLCADNAFMLLTQARLFDEPQLAALCLETIDKATPEALAAEGFTDIDIDTLSAVLDRDSLRIKEAKLFSAVLRWSEAECLRQNLPSGSSENKRSVLGRVLRQIRFPLMTVEEFAQCPAQSGILTDRECVSLFLHFTVNPKPPVAFMDIPRCSMTGKEQTVCRFQQIESRWGYSGTSDKIRFIVDRRIFVVGFGLYGSIHGPSEYQVNIQIIHTGSGRLLGSNEISFSSDGTNATFRVMFKEPIEIQHNTNYTASATLKGLDSHYGTKGLRKVSVECPTGGKVTFQFSYAAGNNNGTSVEDGQIPEIIFYT